MAKRRFVLLTRLGAVGPADPPIHAPSAADRAVFAEEILKSRPKIWCERMCRELHFSSFAIAHSPLGFASKDAAGIVVVIDGSHPSADPSLPPRIDF
jgi:hypothetical protein